MRNSSDFATTAKELSFHQDYFSGNVKPVVKYTTNYRQQPPSRKLTSDYFGDDIEILIDQDESCKGNLIKSKSAQQPNEMSCLPKYSQHEYAIKSFPKSHCHDEMGEQEALIPLHMNLFETLGNIGEDATLDKNV